LFGTLLTWLNDHETDVFFVGTLNDVSKLPPEFSRAERFDGVFFVDLPGQREKQTIWQMYLERFGLNLKQQRPVRLDRSRDSGLLPALGPLGHAATRSRQKHRASRSDGSRVGRAAPELGQRPLPVGGQARHLSPRRQHRSAPSHQL